MSVSAAINISSVIVGALPGGVDAVQEQLTALTGVEVHAAAEDGRLIVTIEAPSDRVTADTFEAIRQLPGVLSAAMVYHQYETDPDEEA